MATFSFIKNVPVTIYRVDFLVHTVNSRCSVVELLERSCSDYETRMHISRCIIGQGDNYWMLLAWRDDPRLLENQRKYFQDLT